MTDYDHKLAMATQLLEQAKEAARNPGDEQTKVKLVDHALVVAMSTTTDLMRKCNGLDKRVGALETALEDTVSKEEVEEMLEQQAAETQKAQRKERQEVLRESKREASKLVDAKIKALEAKLARGAKRAAPTNDAGGNGGRGPKRERNEYDANKYTFVGADGTEKTMAGASFEDIKDLYLALEAAKKEEGRIERNLTLTADNLKRWRVSAEQGRVPRNKASGRYVYLSAFLEEGKHKAAQALLAEREVEAVRI